MFIYWDAYPPVADRMYCIDAQKVRLGNLQKTFATTVAKININRCYDMYLKEGSAAGEGKKLLNRFPVSFCEPEWG